MLKDDHHRDILGYFSNYMGDHSTPCLAAFRKPRPMDKDGPNSLDHSRSMSPELDS